MPDFLRLDNDGNIHHNDGSRYEHDRGTYNLYGRDYDYRTSDDDILPSHNRAADDRPGDGTADDYPVRGLCNDYCTPGIDHDRAAHDSAYDDYHGGYYDVGGPGAND